MDMRRRRDKVIKLDREITIEQGTITKGATGQEVLTWSTYATVRAAKMDGGGSEALKAGRETDLSKVVFTIRYNAGVTQKMRIVYNTIVHDIIQINEKGRRHYQELITEFRE